MRRLAFVGCVGLVSLLVGLAPRAADKRVVTLRVVEAGGREISALVAFRNADGTALRVESLMSRGVGLDAKEPIHDWHVLPKATKVELPAEAVAIEAIAGLEHEATRVALDAAALEKAEVTLTLKRFSDLRAAGWRSGNTHLHLMKLTRAASDTYLREIPKADGLDTVFVSYLERAGADQDYITNRYTRDDLAEIDRASGVRFGNGEEHRHNFEGFGQGYGHVMLLDIRELVQPVSIGPGIMKAGTDGLPLARGLDAARKAGATIVWCHNRWGLEAAPNFLTGRVAALNINDGGPHGSFKDSFYRYWNAGVPVSFSTGTDWFQYDFSRVYVDLDGDVTVGKWLAALRDGRTFVTNGPLLRFAVAGKKPGQTVALASPGAVPVEAIATGRADFGRVELVRNGAVIARARAEKVGGHYEARLSTTLDVDGPCWLAVRTPPPPVKDDKELTEAVGRNEFDKELFSHTTPVSIEVAGRRHRDPAVCRALLAEMETSQATILKHGRFADDAERERVLDVYRDAIRLWRAQIVE